MGRFGLRVWGLGLRVFGFCAAWFSSASLTKVLSLLQLLMTWTLNSTYLMSGKKARRKGVTFLVPNERSRVISLGLRFLLGNFLIQKPCWLRVMWCHEFVPCVAAQPAFKGAMTI